MLSAELMMTEMKVYFHEANHNTSQYLDSLYRTMDDGFFVEQAFKVILSAATPFNLQENLDAKKKVVSHCFDVIFLNQQNLFLRDETRDDLLQSWLDMASGFIPTHVLINTASDGKLPLSPQFRGLDLLTQFFILMQLRQLLDQLILKLPLFLFKEDNGIVLAKKTIDDFGAISAWIEKHHERRWAVFSMIQNFLFKESTLKKISDKNMAHMEKAVAKLMRLIAFHRGEGMEVSCAPSMLYTPTFSAIQTGFSTPSCRLFKTRSFEPTLLSLKAPFLLSDELKRDISACYVEIGRRYDQAKKNVDLVLELNLIQQYHTVAELHQLVFANESDLTPSAVHTIFFAERVVIENNREIFLSQDLIFEAEGTLWKTKSKTELLYEKMKTDLKKGLWDRVKNCDLKHDVIIKKIAAASIQALKGVAQDLKTETEALFDSSNHKELSTQQILKVKEQLATDILLHQVSEEMLSAAVIEGLKKRAFIPSETQFFFFSSSKIASVVQHLQEELQECLWQLAVKNFEGFSVYIDPESSISTLRSAVS